jgi:hypothetical protein
MPQNHDHH